MKTTVLNSKNDVVAVFKDDKKQDVNAKVNEWTKEFDKRLNEFLINSYMTHSIFESTDEYCQDCGKDLDNNGSVDEKDYELYLNNKVLTLDHGVHHV